KLLRLDGLAPFRLDDVHFFAVGLTHVGPALAEGAIDQVQYFPIITDAVARGGFPQPGTRRGRNVYARFRIKDLPQFRLYAGKQRLEVRRTMPDHPFGLRLKNILPHLNWAGDK